MRIRLLEDSVKLGEAAAAHAADRLRATIAREGRARIIAATGAAQFAFLSALVRDRTIDWASVELFHLDEYVGLSRTHPASFRRFLLDRLIEPAGIRTYHLLDGEADPGTVCQETGEAIRQAPIDIAFVGIGENAHLAFNDPPADFDTDQPYLVVRLDHACRSQQVGEGWFASIDEVPTHAISMSVRQILAAKEILAIVPERRKAQAVRAAVEGPITSLVPASVLRTHPSVTLYLDRESASLLASGAHDLSQ